MKLLLTIKQVIIVCILICTPIPCWADQSTFQTGDDNYLDGANTTTNQGGAAGLTIKDGNDNFTRIPVLRFDISSIPANATVTAVKLDVVSTGNYSGTTHYLYDLLRTDWVELESTWTIYKTSNNWTTAGCRSDGNDMTGTFGTGTGDIAVLTAASFVTDGTYTFSTNSGFVANIQANLGGSVNFVMHETTNNNVFVQYKSFDHVTAGHRPLLTVDYTVPAVAVDSTMAGPIGTVIN